MKGSVRAVAILGVVVLAVVAVVLFLDNGSDHPRATPRQPAHQTGSSGSVNLSSLPAEARTTVAAIQRGGPFPYSQDGTVFGNREGLLPPEPRGYYHEYTVPTPGSSDRGARRIVAGKTGQLYYSDDHYQSFRNIRIHR
jgi:ribonuclease T1